MRREICECVFDMTVLRERETERDRGFYVGLNCYVAVLPFNTYLRRVVEDVRMEKSLVPNIISMNRNSMLFVEYLTIEVD